MSESNRALQEFVAFLGSPDMYGSMSLAASMMKWAVHFVVTLLMIAAVIGVLFVVLRFAIDIVYLSGLGNFIKTDGDSRGAKIGAKINKLASPQAIKGDVMAYIKEDMWKFIITLAFIGLLATGMLLPLAAQVAGMIGAGVDKILGLDPATQIADFDFGEFKKSVEYTRPKDLKQQYDKAVSAASSYREQIYTIGSKGSAGNQETIDRFKRLYTGEILKAQAISSQVSGKAAELKLPSTYFNAHKKLDVCTKNFLDKGVSENFGVSVTCSNK